VGSTAAFGRGVTLERVTREALIETYWRHHRLVTAARPPLLAVSDTFWANEEVLAAVGAPDPDAIELLAELAATAPDDEALVHLGAGPVEEFVHAHGDELGHDLALAARDHPRLRTALANVWFAETVDDELVGQLRWLGPQ
jgi:hypothetical protein